MGALTSQISKDDEEDIKALCHLVCEENVSISCRHHVIVGVESGTEPRGCKLIHS